MQLRQELFKGLHLRLDKGYRQELHKDLHQRLVNDLHRRLDNVLHRRQDKDLWYHQVCNLRGRPLQLINLLRHKDLHPGKINKDLRRQLLVKAHRAQHLEMLEFLAAMVEAEVFHKDWMKYQYRQEVLASV